MENQFFLNAGHSPFSVCHQLAPAASFSPEKSMDSFLNPAVHFDSTSSNVSGEGFFIREMIEKLGKNKKYSTPLSSASKLNCPTMAVNSNVAKFSDDPGFAERAARFSCFGSKSFNGRTNQFPSYRSILMADGKLSRVSSSPSLKSFGSNSPLESMVSEQISNDMNGRKRKAKSKGSEANQSFNGKRLKVEKPEEVKTSKTKSNPKLPELHKDYIHVRARRGQATDSHSLAERVRREKISERMKLLQDLVPGCNKVTGKAPMLDEIINYVQSLQCQVEFLSMKLASVNTQKESTMDSLISKEVFESSNSLSNPIFSNDSSPSAIYGRHNLGLQLPSINENFSQYPLFGEDNLQSIVQMGIGQSRFPFQISAMEIELEL